MANSAGNKDFTQMALDKLVAEEQKLRSQRIPTAVFVGFLAGIAVYAAATKGAILLPIILVVAVYIIGRNASKKLKQVRDEIARRTDEANG